MELQALQRRAGRASIQMVQHGQMYMAQSVWEWIEENHPEALGDENPHNAEIESVH